MVQWRAGAGHALKQTGGLPWTVDHLWPARVFRPKFHLDRLRFFSYFTRYIMFDIWMI
jgi:hypothetical protein